MKNGNRDGDTARAPLAFTGASAASPSLRQSPRADLYYSSTSPRSLVPPLVSPRSLDPDRFQRDLFDDRDIFGRFVADHSSTPLVRNGNNNGSTSPSMASSVVFSRALAHPTDGVDTQKSLSSPRQPPVPVQPASPTRAHASTSRPSPSKTRHLHILRPHSPVGDVAPESVVTLRAIQQLSPRASPHKAILSAPDVEKITAWLHSLKRETRQFSSYFLYCETLFRESESLLKGKAMPNRLQTAVAFHCLCQATSVFSRHEHVLLRICHDLAAAIFTSPIGSRLPGAGPGEATDALEYYANKLTYYDQQRVLRQQRDDMERDLQVETAKHVERVKDDKLNLAKIKDLEARYKVQTLEQISQRNTASVELNDKLHVVLQSFRYMDEPEKQRVVLGVIEALKAHITADTLVAITSQISHYERDKLLRELFQDDIVQLTEKIRSEVIATSSAQQSAFLERSAARITLFQTLLWDRLRSSSASSEGGGTSHSHPLHDDDDLCDQDRKVLESLTDVMEELQAVKRHNAALEEQLREAEQATNNLRWKSNAQLNEAQDAAVRHAKELVELREELVKAAVSTDDKEIQTERSKRSGRFRGGGGGGGIDDDDDDDDDGGLHAGGGGGRGRRRRGANGVDDDELLVKNRRLNQYGFGFATLIEQAKIPSSKIRKILAKRKPLTLNELHAIIVGYYQAKMLQDAQDDAAGKLRGNLAQFILDMYTLHYGLKDLAISQLVFLDASIRKHAADSARVRSFGMLTGSLEPDSQACSVQGIDFFLFVVVVIFNAGIYKRGRKQSVHVAQNLKTFFGEGIFMSPKSVLLRSDVVCTSVELIFSYMRNDPGGTLDRLKDEVRALCAGHPNGEMEIDDAMDKILSYWLMLYEQQIVDIHAMFALVDTNGDGTLDFREFCEVVQVLEPTMDRREILSIYNKAAGDDHVLDKDEFVQVMLSHQRGLILKEFYNTESTKKSISAIQQRKPTFGVDASAEAPTPAPSNTSLQYMATASGMAAQLDREESYASLVAAMGVMPESLAPSEDQDDEDDDDAKEDHSAMHNDVSFRALSRLSVWASEAKAKLLGGGSQALESSPTPDFAARLPAIPPPPIEPRSVSPPLARIAEIADQSHQSFESDVSALLHEALAKANIDLNDVF